MAFPTSLDSFPTLVDNVDNILATHPNSLGTALVAVQAKIGVDSSAVTTSHDYKLRNLPAQDTNWNAGATRNVSAQNFTSVVATGTAPLTVSSTTKVTNLNADAIDGLDYLDIYKAIYPIGIVVTFGVSTNPATLFGFGTWTAIEGMVIVGKAASGTFNTLDGTGGAETVTLTAAQSGLPAHTHTVTNQRNANGWGSGDYFQGSNDSGPVQNLTVPANSSADASSAHTNLQPYIVKYVWQRTA